ncbi:hypothetical protein [Robinsoniella sp. KNHs210]
MQMTGMNFQTGSSASLLFMINTTSLCQCSKNLLH